MYTMKQNLSNVMNAVRKLRKLSITELSEELGISRSSTQELLNGKGNPRMDTLELIAARLHICPALLVCSWFTKEQWEITVFLLESVGYFVEMSDDKRKTAAALIYQLILILSPAK